MSENKLLRRDFIIYILNDFATKKEIFETHYDNLFSNHFARA